MEGDIGRCSWSHTKSFLACARGGLYPGDMGRYGEIWGEMGRDGEIWGDMGRYGETWGDMGRYGEIQRDLVPARAAGSIRSAGAA